MSNSACLIRPHNALSLVYPPARGAGKALCARVQDLPASGAQQAGGAGAVGTRRALPPTAASRRLLHPQLAPVPPSRALRWPFRFSLATPAPLPRSRDACTSSWSSATPRRVAKTRDRIKVYPEEGTRRRRARTPALGSLKLRLDTCQLRNQAKASAGVSVTVISLTCGHSGNVCTCNRASTRVARGFLEKEGRSRRGSALPATRRREDDAPKPPLRAGGVRSVPGGTWKRDTAGPGGAAP